MNIEGASYLALGRDASIGSIGSQYLVGCHGCEKVSCNFGPAWVAIKRRFVGLLLRNLHEVTITDIYIYIYIVNNRVSPI